MNERPREIIGWKEPKIVLVMVGLPARGKSYIAKKLVSYLNWIGIPTKLFNVGDVRRKEVDGTQTADFFSAGNVSAKETREKLAMDVLHQLLEYLRKEGSVAVFDATNTTDERRKSIREFCARSFPESEGQLQIIFIESICTDSKVLHENFIQKATNSPDYKNMPLEDAIKDLAERIRNYEKVYRTIEDDSLSYIKLINLKSKMIANRISGIRAQFILQFLMSIHTQKRAIWLTRVGHSDEVNDLNRIFARNKSLTTLNPLMEMTLARLTLPTNKSKHNVLSEKGKEYARRLAEFVKERCKEYGGLSQLLVFTSTTTRALQTAEPLGTSQPLSALNMLDTGILNGMSLEEIKRKFPDEWTAWQKDPFHYRLPGGESYADVVNRLDPFVVELEQADKPILVVSHISTLQVLYAYFVDCPVEQSPNLGFPLHTVIELIPHNYGWKQTRHCLLPVF